MKPRLTIEETVRKLAEFVATRLDEFLSGRQPDLVKAFGLTLPRRGRRPSLDARQKHEIAAARVLELMPEGKTLDEACEIAGRFPRARSPSLSSHAV